MSLIDDHADESERVINRFFDKAALKINLDTEMWST